MPGRILVIRGGALGDFLLTLPALRLLREQLPEAEVHVLGYRHIVSLAEGRYYAQATRSIEYGPLSSFFSRQAELPSDLVEYFRSFSLVVSYLFDPDGIFGGNLARAGVKDLLVGPGKIQPKAHATAQLAAPLASLALYLEDDTLQIFPSHADRQAAEALVKKLPFNPGLAVHPGSGGTHKNWPFPCWVELLENMLLRHPEEGLLVVGGEADGSVLASLRRHFAGEARVSYLENQPLPHVGAVLERIGRFIGHDSGITHLAAAAGCRGIALFGPTDPEVWAPPNPGITVLRADGCRMEALAPEMVIRAAEDLWS